MNTQNTLEQLKGLKLTGMAKRYEAALSLPVHEQEACSLRRKWNTESIPEHRSI